MELVLPITNFASFFLVFVRVGAIMMTAPLLGHRSVPAIWRLGFAGMLSFILLLAHGEPSAPLPTEPFAFLIVMAQELVVGLMVGFACRLVFEGIRMAGRLVGLQMGLGFGGLFGDGSEEEAQLFDQLYYLMAILIFLGINGHHWLIMEVGRTFDLMPLGTLTFDGAVPQALITLTGNLFLVAAKISLPVVGTLLLADLALTITGRAMPQMQVFIVGLPLKIMLGFFTIMVALPFTVDYMGVLFHGITRDVELLMQQL